jgi:hypothetical protein
VDRSHVLLLVQLEPVFNVFAELEDHGEGRRVVVVKPIVKADLREALLGVALFTAQVVHLVVVPMLRL